MAVQNQNKQFQKAPEVKAPVVPVVPVAKVEEQKVIEQMPPAVDTAVVEAKEAPQTEQAPSTVEQSVQTTDAKIEDKEPTTLVVEEKAPVLAAAVVIEAPKAPALNDLEANIAFIKANGTVMANTALAGMEAYIVKMAPGKPMDKIAGAANQVSLWRTIKSTIEHSREDFNLTFTAMLGLWNKHKDGVFGERYVHRFMDTVSMDKDEVFAFLAILDLMRMTANPVGRKEALRQVDMNRALGREFSEQGRQNVLGFYGL